jgi:hypothetical protein
VTPGLYAATAWLTGAPARVQTDAGAAKRRRPELHNHRWSEDALAEDADRWYAGWAGVEKPRDLRVVSDTIVNVQTGTGNRIEFWDGHGTPFASKGKTRRYIDVGRLTTGGN